MNAISVTGVLIGGPSYFFTSAGTFFCFTTFRADITSLGVVSPGANSLTLSDMSFTGENNGSGVLVVYDDGTPDSQIGVRDGQDLAFINFPEPRKSTVAQTFTFASATVDRVANLAMFFGSVSAGALRPTSVEVTVGSSTTIFSNVLGGNDGSEWDTVNLPSVSLPDIVIPAGTTELTIQAFSRDDSGDGQDPLAASFSWIGAGLSVNPPPTPAIDIIKYTNGLDANDPVNGTDVPVVGPGESVVWTYDVENVGTVDIPEADISVTDNIAGVNPVFDSVKVGDADNVLEPGEVWTYTATGVAVNLVNPPSGLELVTQACNQVEGSVPGSTAYTNIGTVTIPSMEATDPSSYCGPLPTGLDDDDFPVRNVLFLPILTGVQ